MLTIGHNVRTGGGRNGFMEHPKFGNTNGMKIADKEGDEKRGVKQMLKISKQIGSKDAYTNTNFHRTSGGTCQSKHKRLNEKVGKRREVATAGCNLGCTLLTLFCQTGN